MLKSRTLDEYLAMPRRERTTLGVFYLTPFAMEWDEWDRWHDAMRKAHPLQYRLRTWFSNFCGRSHARWRDAYYAVRSIFRPCHPTVRAAIPRRWQDLVTVMEDVNFAIIRAFRQEMIDGCVDWTYDEQHREFEAWIIGAVKYLDERQLLIDSEGGDTPDGELPMTKASKDADPENAERWQQWSRDSAKAEYDMRQRDTELLKQMIDFRGYFWT